MWGFGHGWFWPGAPFSTFFSVGLIVLGLWLLLGSARAWGRARGNHARDILDERYAAGELSTAEYQERLEYLRQG
jgi:uncharacterized membrane protein